MKRAEARTARELELARPVVSADDLLTRMRDGERILSIRVGDPLNPVRKYWLVGTDVIRIDEQFYDELLKRKVLVCDGAPGPRSVIFRAKLEVL
jgi:hypothetical protein